MRDNCSKCKYLKCFVANLVDGTSWTCARFKNKLGLFIIGFGVLNGPVWLWFPTPTHNSKQQTSLCQKIQFFFSFSSVHFQSFVVGFLNLLLPKRAPFLVRNMHNTCFLFLSRQFSTSRLDRANLVKQNKQLLRLCLPRRT